MKHIPKRIKASYTVEGAVIISFSFIVIGIAIGIAYDMFVDILDAVSIKENTFDAIDLFRKKEGVVELWRSLTRGNIMTAIWS